MKYYIFHITTILFGSIILCMSCHYGPQIPPDELYSSFGEDIDHIMTRIGYEELSNKEYAHLILKGSELLDSLHRPMFSDTLLSCACNYYSSVSDYVNEGKCRYYLGRFYAKKQDEEKAMREYLLALELVDSTRRPDISGYICSYMADLYASEMDTNQAFEYYRKAENLFRRAGNLRSQIIAIRDQGYTFNLDLNHSEAIRYYLLADSMLTMFPNSRLHSSVLNRLGFSYMKLGSLERAREYFNKSILLNPENLSARFSLVRLNIHTENPIEGRQILFNLLDSFADVASRHQIYNHLYKLEKSVGRYDSALYNLEMSNMYLDSLLSYRHNEELLSVEKKYQQEQIRTVNMRLRLERNRVWLTCALLFILLIASLGLYREELGRRKRKYLELQRDSELHRHQAEKERLEKEAKENEVRVKEKELAQKNRLIDMV